ncbi:MAG: ArnT family glycosyltransferase [Hyphomicrobiaceae bacterium]
MGLASVKSDVQRQSRWQLWLVALLAALLALRLAALAFNRTDLFFDEAQYWSWSLEPAFGYYSKPPLIAWIIGLARSVCGDGEFCVRLPSPVMHTVTALAVYGLGTRLYDARTGFFAAAAFATLPGISLSAGIISTDVPLLMCWAMALWALAAMIEARDGPWWPPLVLGAALGLGLNAKYAMAYFVLCLAVYLAFTPERRWLLRDRRLWLAFGLGVVLIVPNLLWNAGNGFSTFAHTADNAKWSGSLFRPGKALEFLGAQFGVFGPILFGAYLVIAWRWLRRGLEPSDRLLLAFSLPIIAVVTVQAFISRAHANWAAPAYVSATVLVVATMLRGLDRKWLTASFWIHGAVIVLLSLAMAQAGRISPPFGRDPFARTMGWKELAAATEKKLSEARRAGTPYAAVITDERAATAELIYYMRGEATPVQAWYGGGRPHDHYELTRPFRDAGPGPLLLVALRPDSGGVPARFEQAELLDDVMLPAGASARRVRFYRLNGFKGFASAGRSVPGPK